jgi:hypothetical protein
LKRPTHPLNLAPLCLFIRETPLCLIKTSALSRVSEKEATHGKKVGTRLFNAADYKLKAPLCLSSVGVNRRQLVPVSVQYKLPTKVVVVGAANLFSASLKTKVV